MTSHFRITGVEKNVALRALSLFAGVGGLDLGVGLARNHRTICYVEREIYPASVLAARMADKTLDEAPIWSDLATFDCTPWRGCVDLITASPPCQPYSVAGAKKGLDDERGGAVLEHLARIIGEVGPPLVFMENVGEWVTGGYFRDFGQRLSGLGYRIPPPVYVTAGSVGAPHRRERVFILAHRDGGGLRGQSGRAGIRDGRPECGHDPDGCDEAVGYVPGRDGTTDKRILRPREIQPGRTSGSVGDGERKAAGGVGKSDAALADTGGGGRQTEGKHPRNGSETPAVRQTDEHRSGGDDVANTSEQGSQRQSATGPARPHDGDTGRSSGAEIFPPGPNDTAAWATILADHPERAPALESNFCRMVDGVAYQLDERTNRLRCTGNGVVPMAAAVAFDVLLTEIGL